MSIDREKSLEVPQPGPSQPRNGSCYPAVGCTLARTNKEAGMASSKSHPLLIAVALTLLLIVNLTAPGCLLWLIEEGWPGPSATFLRNQLHQIGFGILLSQVILIGYWLGLGDNRWYLR